MAFINALVWAILAVTILYGGVNVLFIAQISPYEKRVGAYDVWMLRLIKSVGVAIVAVLWLLFG